MRLTNKFLFPLFTLALLLAGVAVGQSTSSCSSCAEWNRPQAPFRIFGNTYYVGPHGLSSVLITSSSGHVLIDGALPESAKQIAANIAALGFRIQDVKVIVNSHVHFDHAGGIAELQRMSGARVMASPWSASVLRHGGVGRGDPQYGTIPGIARVKNVAELHDGSVVRVGSNELTAHFTPGHTPGGTSWTWKSCEGSICHDMVYADSLAPISAAGFKFSSSRVFPNAIEGFQKSFAIFDSTPCDILITAHPELSVLWDRLDARKRSGNADSMVDPGACKVMAHNAIERLQQRLAEEQHK